MRTFCASPEHGSRGRASIVLLDDRAATDATSAVSAGREHFFVSAVAQRFLHVLVTRPLARVSRPRRMSSQDMPTDWVEWLWHQYSRGAPCVRDA